MYVFVGFFFNKIKNFGQLIRLCVVWKIQWLQKRSLHSFRKYFFFGSILLDGEMKVWWYLQIAKNLICIHKSRYRKMYCNTVKYHLDLQRQGWLRELPNSSKYVIKLQRKEKCTLKCPFSVLCQYFIFQRTQSIFQEFH